MQVNVANSNIVNKENTIVNIGVDNETPIKSSGKIQEDKVTIYKIVIRQTKLLHIQKM